MSTQDEVLEYLVRRVEETGVGMDVTLCVNGVIITGSIMRSQLSFDDMSTLFTHNKTEITTDDPIELEIGRKYSEHFKQFMEERRKGDKERDNPKYIHMHKVMIYTSDPSHPYASDIWRGRISSIDGFSLGRAVPIRIPSEEKKDG